MGFLPFQILSPCSSLRSSKVKILTLHGQWLKFDPPISVSQVLSLHPSHSLFSASMVKQLGNRAATPLIGTAHLQPGHLYFLIPASPRVSSSSSASSSNVRTSSHASSPLSPSSQPPRPCLPSGRCSQVTSAVASQHGQNTSTDTTSISLKPSCPSQKTLSSPTRGVRRLKIVLSKHQFASILLKAGSDSTSLIADLLRLESGSAPMAMDHDQNHISINHSYRAWKPTLQSIPESF